VIPRDIPIYIWWGTKDTTVPEKFVEYFKKEYEVTKIHMIDNIGHMLYLPYWTEIINEVRGC
jgi:pimeloyl-ACP methyl ester carboxylesterase